MYIYQVEQYSIDSSIWVVYEHQNFAGLAYITLNIYIPHKLHRMSINMVL